MKNMKKLLQKAMVFTLTAAMLVGTPLTASAAGLVDLYQIEDGWGNVTGNEDNTRTGTVTATQTNSGILDANAQLEGIVLDETNVELEIPEEKPTRLTASLDWGTVDGTVPEKYKALHDDLLKRLQWKVADGGTAIVALDTKSVEGKFKGGPRDVITLKPKAAGTTTVTVSLDSAEHNIHYSATATITVVQYADKLEFNGKIKKYAVTGNSIALDEYVDTYVGGKLAKTSDTLTFALKAESKVATLKNGVLTLKKQTGPISILAIGKNCKSEWYSFDVTEGNNAKTIVFKDSTGNVLAKNKFDWVVNTLGKSTTVSAEVTETKNNKKPCTDKISWSSKKPAIVDVATTSSMELDENDKCSVTLIAKSAGKGQIVAKASSGKSVTLNVTVSANLKNIKIENETMKFYSGQTVDLYDVADQYFGKDKNDTSAETGNKNFTDAGLKWVFVGDNNAQKPMKKLASINAKGVLTIKPDITTGITGDKVIKVQAVNAKKVGDNRPGTIKSNELTINLEQVNVTSITVKKGDKSMAGAVANKGVITQVPKKGETDTVAVDGSRIYKLVVSGSIGNDPNAPVVELDPAVLGWTASGNGKIVKASRNAVSNGVIRANNKGTATITVNSATKNKQGTKYIPIKTTFKVKVTAPTKTLTLTVKNKGIAATDRDQTISITPVIQKGSTTNKTKDIIWKAYKESDPTKTFSADKGKLKLKKGEYAAGDVFVVRASVVNGGPQTSIRLTVVKESKNVEFQDASGAKVTKLNKIENDQTVTAKVNLKSGGTPVLPGKDNVSGVTYTVNKTGIVRIVENKDGTITIEPLNSGSVKITAKTLDGKTGNLNVTVK